MGFGGISPFRRLTSLRFQNKEHVKVIRSWPFWNTFSTPIPIGPIQIPTNPANTKRIQVSFSFSFHIDNSRSLDAWGSDKLLSPTSARQTSKSLDNLYSDNPVSPAIPSTEETLPNLYQRLMDAEGEKRQLMSEVRKLESLVERHESLRVTRVGVEEKENA